MMASNYYKEYQTKDSGHRRSYPGGAQRDRASGKGRYDLITPLAIRRIAGVYERGSLKYDDRNWEKGMPLSCFLDSALRHIFQYIEGLRDEDHLAQAGWNLLAAVHTEECIQRGVLPQELDDLPNYLPPLHLAEEGMATARAVSLAELEGLRGGGVSD